MQARSWPGLGHHSEAMGSIAFGGHGCGTEQPSTPEPSQLYSHHERLGGTAFVAMMEAADLRERDNLAGSGRVYRSALRTILGEREMRSRLVVIVKVRRQHAAQMMLIEDDDVIQTFTADRTNDAFDVAVLPRRARRSNNLLDTHHTNAIAKNPGHMTDPDLAAGTEVPYPTGRPRKWTTG